jgi:hypothetical protein
MTDDQQPTVETPAEPTPDTQQTFTQADLDRIVQQRIQRERAKFADYDEVKAAADRLSELEAAQLTELEKATQKANAAEAARDEALSRAKQMLVRAAVIEEAARAGAVDADVVAALLPQDALTVEDDGSVSGVRDAVKDLLKSKPFLAQQNTQAVGSADSGPRGAATPSQLTRDHLAGMTPQQIVEARRAGLLNDLLAGK